MPIRYHPSMSKYVASVRFPAEDEPAIKAGAKADGHQVGPWLRGLAMRRLAEQGRIGLLLDQRNEG